MMEDFYRENYPIVYGYLLALCGDAALAEELTAATFCRAVEKIDTYDARFQPSTWLCTIGRNLYLNLRKKAARQVPLEEFILVDGISPEEQLLHKEKLRILLRLLGELEEQKRQLFLLRSQGLSFREMGEALGKSENWARVTYFRIKESLLQRMEELL
jgi:RNA polymerase sigma-70 factor (ECF subfamily)